MAVKQQQSPEEVDREFNRIVGEEFKPDQNPIQAGYDKALNNPSTNLHAQERQAAERATANTLGGEGLEPSKQSIEQAKEAEERADTLGGDWRDKYTGKNSKHDDFRKYSLRKFAKEKGAIGFIIAVIIGGFGAGSLLFSPSILIVHFKEVLFNDLNDQVAALESRSYAVMTSRMKKQTTSGLCTERVSVRCKFKGVSRTFIANITDAGATVTCEGPCDRRRGNRIVSIRFPDGTLLDDPARFTSVMIGNREARAVMNRAYNPVFYGMWDRVASNRLDRLGISRARALDGATTEENRERIRTAGNTPSIQGGSLTPQRNDPNDPDRITGYTDEQGRTYSTADAERMNAAQSSLSGATGGAASKVVSGVVGTVGVIGLADTACQAIKTVEVVSVGAKAIRTVQAMQASVPINNTADSIIAQDSNIPAVSAVGEALTERNQDKTVIDDGGKTIDNPRYGYTATDSPAFQAASLGHTPRLTSADSRYMLGTPTTGVLGNLSTYARRFVNPSLCGAIQNPWVRTGNALLGVAAAIFTGGLSTTQMVAQGAIGVTISVGMAYAEALLKDLAAGDISEYFKADGIGQIAFAGTGSMLQEVGGARGMGFQTTANIDEYNKLRAESRDRFVAVEKMEAEKDPFNPLLRYSFTGSLARQLIPIYTASSPARAITASLSLPMQSLAHILQPNLQALTVKPYDRERFEQCQDPTYVSMGIKADFLCNLRRAMSTKELNMDAEENMEWMISNGYVEDGEAADIEALANISKGDYKKFLDYCVSRASAIPGVSENEGGEEDWETQRNCIDDPVDITQDQLSRFRVFTLDFSVTQGMDDGPEGLGSVDAEETAGNPQSLAQQLANNSDITFKQSTKSALLNYAETGEAINLCDSKFTINPLLSSSLIRLSEKYRITINSLGFKGEGSCTQTEYTKGNAAEIGRIELKGGADSGSPIAFNASTLPVLQGFANDWLITLPADRGGVGQKGCANFTVTPPAGALNPGLAFVDGPCDRLDIDVRRRQ